MKRVKSQDNVTRGAPGINRNLRWRNPLERWGWKTPLKYAAWWLKTHLEKYDFVNRKDYAIYSGKKMIETTKQYEYRYLQYDM